MKKSRYAEEQIIDMHHPRVLLGMCMDWALFEEAMVWSCRRRNRRPGRESVCVAVAVDNITADHPSYGASHENVGREVLAR